MKYWHAEKPHIARVGRGKRARWVVYGQFAHPKLYGAARAWADRMNGDRERLAG